MTARESLTRSYWRNSQAVLRGDLFAKESLIILAKNKRPEIEPLAIAATRSLVVAVRRNG